VLELTVDITYCTAEVLFPAIPPEISAEVHVAALDQPLDLAHDPRLLTKHYPQPLNRSPVSISLPKIQA